LNKRRREDQQILVGAFEEKRILTSFSIDLELILRRYPETGRKIIESALDGRAKESRIQLEETFNKAQEKFNKIHGEIEQ